MPGRWAYLDRVSGVMAVEFFMKKSFIVIFALVLVGCASSHQTASLNAEQAKILALQLANDKASSVYHCRPFHDGQPARFKEGHWVWTDKCGLGRGDIQAEVELASNGQARKVDVMYMTTQPILRDF